MTSNSKHFDEKKAAAVLKHAVLQSYLVPFVSMTSLQTSERRAWFVDAYAGQGKYDDGSKGSPLIALDAAKAVAAFGKEPRDLRCVFIEQNRTKVKQLNDNITADGYASAYVILHGDASAKLEEALGHVGTDPVLTFLDPFGTSLPRSLVVEKLLKRNSTHSSEVLLNFHVLTVARIGPLARRESELDEGGRKTLQRLDTFLGYEGWRDLFLGTYQPGNEGSAMAAARVVADDYRKRITDETGYQTFPVEVRRSAREQAFFELTLMYKGNTPAEYKFADAAAHANAKWRQRISEDEARADAEKYSGALSIFGADFSKAEFDKKWKAEEKKLQAEWTTGIEQNIRGLISGVPVPMQGNVGRFFGDFIGLASETHLRRAWNNLADQGLVNRCPTERVHYAVLTRS